MMTELAEPAARICMFDANASVCPNTHVLCPPRSDLSVQTEVCIVVLLIPIARMIALLLLLFPSARQTGRGQARMLLWTQDILQQ